ncbi:hypothetical protein PS417_25030 [Pseudomonas simiae]|jgi:putative transposase|uniref:Integrase catalytic domain-containing protein n=1 Tax=Pseudomonas simiae TaxID=321846 RepID=A0A1N7UP62_9PSED|nr:hypothetical protein PS417_25030 [Pseudomonas simiae]
MRGGFFFQQPEKERIHKRIYKARDIARADVFDYMEALYNRTRRHRQSEGMNPEAFVVPYFEAGNFYGRRG